MESLKKEFKEFLPVLVAISPHSPSYYFILFICNWTIYSYVHMVKLLTSYSNYI
jgi:hypothetical protein